MLKENVTLVNINLCGNEFDDHAATPLAEAFMSNHKVQSIDLSHNLMGEGAGEVLGNAIAENTGMKELNLSWNCFREMGSIPIAKGLGANIFLRAVDLSYNGFGKTGAAALGEALKVNNVLEHLNVRHFPIAIPTASDAKQPRYSTVKTLYEEACKIFGVVPASYFLRHMHDQELNLMHHGLGPQGAKALSVPLVTNTSVLNLNLSDNWLGGGGGVAIAEMLKENCYITASAVTVSCVYRELAQVTQKSLQLAVDNDRVFDDLWGKDNMPVVLNNPYSESVQIITCGFISPTALAPRKSITYQEFAKWQPVQMSPIHENKELGNWLPV
ncbi:Leucine-rich repeat-containing protein 74B [Acipenser ruthenus]|uniref:Leucine-rich repeat-containing protein 74B n=1 Tax=Acipenser ruthenus TaxID=7906 RepID=A0A444V008_ACIRT|nr:Leucine-rich repeat-containing protein 74B [Acipenser ruthenus]